MQNDRVWVVALCSSVRMKAAFMWYLVARHVAFAELDKLIAVKRPFSQVMASRGTQSWLIPSPDVTMWHVNGISQLMDYTTARY